MEAPFFSNQTREIEREDDKASRAPILGGRIRLRGDWFRRGLGDLRN